MRFKRAGILTKIVVLSLLIYMATSLLDLRAQIQQTQMTKDALESQMTEYQLKNQQMSTAIENQDDLDMLEQVAREKGYVKVDETIYIDVAS